ncbi:helix-turn-helix transcriptional regulator [Streptomyces sp. NPDC007325]
MCELAGLSRWTVQEVEAGGLSPTLDTLFLLADAIGVPAADLLG